MTNRVATTIHIPDLGVGLMVMNHVPDRKALLNVAVVFPGVTSEPEDRGENPVPSFMSVGY